MSAYPYERDDWRAAVRDMSEARKWLRDARRDLWRRLEPARMGAGGRVRDPVVLAADRRRRAAADHGGMRGLRDERGEMTEHDPVEHPRHYTSHPSGIECIEITRHMGFNLGNAVKYIWRADLKDNAIEDLRKARWYIDDEIAKREGK